MFKTLVCEFCNKHFKIFLRKTARYCGKKCCNADRIKKTLEERILYKSSQNNHWKRGDIGSDGRVFLNYNKKCRNGERWVSKEYYESLFEERVCNLCSKKYKILKTYSNIFCGNDCAHADRTRIAIEKRGIDGKRNLNGSFLDNPISCLNCKKVFRPVVSQSRDKKVRFCSHICAVKHLTEIRAKKVGHPIVEMYGKRHIGKEVKCLNCQKTFIKPIRRIRATKNFCSRKCSGYYQIGANNHSYKTDRISQKNKVEYTKACRSILSQTLHGFMSVVRSKELLGYDRKALRSHIESQFHSGMSWDNYGRWHIDHIIPVSHFWETDSTTPFNVVNALSNLQPLFDIDNYQKGHKINS